MKKRIKKTTKWMTYSLMFLSSVILNLNCRGNYTPKPYGYFRVDLPTPQYVEIDTVLPYRFHMSNIADLKLLEGENKKHWIDIVYPQLNAEIHCSYKRINNNLYELSEDAHRSVYKHLIKADDIIENVFANPDNRTYGIFYDLKGDAASVAQFTLTDSVYHFFIGAVYFNHTPNKDSIAPMAEYIKNDVIQMIKNFRWK